MSTLDPGFHDPSEAPWWEFTCDDDTLLPVVKQWMGEAALVFAEQLSLRNAGGEVTVECAFTSLDGMTGYYEVTFELHRLPVTMVVSRGIWTKMETDNAEL